MIGYFFVLCLYQLAGEAIIYLTGWPLPAPVLGMALLFVTLIMRTTVPDNLGKTADFLLGSLALLFIPAGVGVITALDLIQQHWLPIGLALFAASILSIMICGIVMQRLGGRSHG